MSDGPAATMAATAPPPRLPRVSVVIPAYRAEQLLETAISSVARQTFRDLEVIVVDDHSPDDTEGAARRLLAGTGLPHTVVRQPVNGGPSAARNRGVALARGEYVAFLDADDEWLPDKLARQVALMDADPAMTLCGCQADWVDMDGTLIRPLYDNLPDRLPDGWKTLLWNCYVATPCAMARREDLGIAPFDTSLRVGEDRDLWIRLASNGVVGLVQEKQVIIRTSEGSFMARHVKLVLEDTLPMIRRHLAAFSDTLPISTRRRAIGMLHSQIGKSLDNVPGQYLRSVGHLLRAVLMGYRPFDSLRQIVLTAPPVRRVKERIKARLRG
jgi:glycosyltransferase involved in cell wall biosynthesis